MSDIRALSELNTAKAHYASARLSQALFHAQNAFQLYLSLYRAASYDIGCAYSLLDALTLLQSLFSLLRHPAKYLSYEPLFEELIHLLFPNHTEVYHAIHLFDVCDHMAANNYLTEARESEQRALSLLAKINTEGTYAQFMKACCDAKLAFHMEDYYTCIDAGHLANSLWYTKEYGQAFPPYIEHTEQTADAIDFIGSNNLLLLCNAYGKINNPKNSIAVLEDLIANNSFQGYQAVSAEITLAVLYAIHQDYEKARSLYQKYYSSAYINYPDVASTLTSLAYLLKERPILPVPGTVPLGYCPGHDGVDSLRYNHALSLTGSGDYEQALNIFRSLDAKGYSMTLALLAHLNRLTEIPALKEKVNQHYYRKSNEIIRHYNEELAYNHLAQLQYHIDLCLGAYCHCNHEDSALLPAQDAYAFLLNTKYLSLEVTYLNRQRNAHSEFRRPLYSTETVCQALPQDTMLLEFTIIRSVNKLSESYGVFLISQNDCHYVPLSDAESMNVLLAQWHQLLQASVTAVGEEGDTLAMEQKNLDAKLRRALFLPLKPYIGNFNSLIIAPAGELVHFPFCRLSTSARTYLGDSHSITYLNTGKELCLENCSADAAKSKSTDTAYLRNPLVIGNPDTKHFPRLPHADAEADMIAYFLHCTPHKGSSATLDLFTEGLAPGTLHIAAHGVFKNLSKDNSDWSMLYQAMQQSGIVLSDDTLLSCIDISTLGWTKTNLAVLSCCHSGQGNYQSTEGVYGLRRTLKLAGCKAIIVSLWQVDDAAAFLWMQRFYEALTIANLSLSEAFQHATDAVRNYEENGLRPFENPYFWAGYILIQ